MFDHLMNEVEAINTAYGWFGCFEAIRYMADHKDEYKGTAVGAELAKFLSDGARMFAPAE